MRGQQGSGAVVYHPPAAAGTPPDITVFKDAIFVDYHLCICNAFQIRKIMAVLLISVAEQTTLN